MIYEKDYILRLIALMGEVLRRLKREVNEAAFDLGLEVFLREYAGLSLKTALTLDAASLAQMTDLRGRLATALALQARSERPAQAPDALPMRETALRLLLSLKEEAEVCRGTAEAVYTLLKQTADALDSPALLEAACFLREAGRLDDMDSAVFFLWEGLPDAAKDAWRGQVLALYAPLRGWTDEALARGGLPRRELDESLRAFLPEGVRET